MKDFKFIHEYNFVMFRITSQLKLCGDTINDVDMMEKNVIHISCLECAFTSTISRKEFQQVF